MADLMQETSTRELPQSVEAERALLGGLLLDPRLMDPVLEVLPPDAVGRAQGGSNGRRRGEPAPEPLFFSTANQAIFTAMLALHNEGVGLDLTTLGEQLRKEGRLESVGGPTYLATLEDDLYTLTQVVDYARIIAAKWRLRCLVRTSQEIVQAAMDTGGAPAEQVIEYAEKRIFEIAQSRTTQDFVPIGEVVVEELTEIEERAKGGGELPGLDTGFQKLNSLTSGFRPSQMVILAARPSMGKTAFAMNIASHVAFRKGLPVGIFSIEMSKRELTNRLLCTESGISMGRVRGMARLRRDELEQLHQTGERLAQAPLHIDDTSALTILEMRARARRLKARCPDLAMIVIDYLQLMSAGGGRYDNRQHEVTEISRAIKGLARELDVPVMALSQLSRQSEQRRGSKDKMPKLSDLRESGAIEQDADIVIFIHRERNMNTEEGAANEPEMANIRIGKQRNGQVGDFEMIFRGDTTRFLDLAPGA